MSLDQHTLQVLLQDQERHRDGVERRREERDAQRDVERTAHMLEITEKMAAMCQAVQSLVLARTQAPAAAPPTGQPPPKIRLQKMTSEDDPEAFLTTFERVAEASSWPVECWAAQLAPCLSGEAQAAYRALSNEAARDYQQVKVAILQRLNITPESHCRKFRHYVRPKGARPRIVAQQLWDHLTRWLQPGDRTKQQLMESVAVDQFLSVLDPGTRDWVARNTPNTMERAVELAEAYEDAALRQDPSPAPVKPKAPTPAPRFPPKPVASIDPSGASPPKWRMRLAPSWARSTPWNPPSGGVGNKQPASVAPPPLICFRCHEAGHIARMCPAAMECDVASRYPAAPEDP
ncbi:uncharacterized protein LOC131697733 [Acipenser ruthenus]|uniref:uncharacterized protein LOC131697733 n=1 Tax=Acipenser ruthenus TaxID=7906 RepID=UPI0027418199|nr:uncharacterized protein LOC131697733 [Acipenser ruthenus]